MIGTYLFQSSLYNTIDINFCFGLALIAVFLKFITTKRIKSFSSDIFLANFILNLVILTVNGIFNILHHVMGYNLLVDILGRINIIIDGAYLLNLTLYFISCIKKNAYENNKTRKLLLFVIPYVLYIISIIIFIPMKMNTYYDVTERFNLNNTMYLYTQTGPATYTVALPILMLLITYCIIFMKYIKQSTKEFKTTIFFTFLSFVIAIVALAFFEEAAAITTALLCLASVSIYFTNESINVKLIDQISKSKEEAEKANKAQEMFLSTVSHDIRTPMNVILGYSESISLDKDSTNREIKEDVKNISLACDELNNLVNRILSVSKIASGTEVIENNEYNLLNIIKELTSDISKDVEQAKINFKIDINPDIPYQLKGDSKKIETIIELITKNIIKNRSNTVDIKFDGKIDEDKLNLIMRINHTGSYFSKEDFNINLNDYLSEISKDKDTFKSDFLGVLIAKEYIKILNGEIKYEENINTWYEITITQDIINSEIIRESELYKNSKRGEQ